MFVGSTKLSTTTPVRHHIAATCMLKMPSNSNNPKAQLTRREQTLYNRLRIGHTYLTHSYLLKDEDPLICIPCNSLLTVKHILISCIDFDIIHQNFYTASNLKDLFHNIHPKCISYARHWPY